MDRSARERRASREEPDPPGRLRTRPSPPLNPQVLPYPGCKSPDGLRSGDGPLSVRACPSSIKRDCDRGTTSTGGKCLVNVHAKSRLTLETLCGHSGQQTRARRHLPGRTRAIPCIMRAVTIQQPSAATTPDSNKHELSPTSSVSWDSGQPPSTAASSGRRGPRFKSGHPDREVPRRWHDRQARRSRPAIICWPFVGETGPRARHQPMKVGRGCQRGTAWA